MYGEARAIFSLFGFLNLFDFIFQQLVEIQWLIFFK